MPPTPGEIATAYHEAGHAVLALALGRDVQRVSVRPNQLRLGNCELKKRNLRRAKDALETDILILLGGLAAEARLTGQYSWNAAAQDLLDARSMIEGRAARGPQAERLERRMLDKAEHLLRDPALWLAVERIATELLRVITLSGRAARHLFEQAAIAAES